MTGNYAATSGTRGPRCRMPPGRLDWIGLLLQVTECMIVSGEVFVVLEVSEAAPGIPLALKVLPPEFLDTSKNNSRDTIAGIVFDGTRRIGYWLFKTHPAIPGTMLDSVLVPASDCLHVFRANRPTDMRGETWFLRCCTCCACCANTSSRIWYAKKPAVCWQVLCAVPAGR